MTKKLSNKIVNQIKKEHIKPAPKWEFLLKDSLVWAGFGLTLLLGAIAISVSIFHIQTANWEFAQHLSANKPSFFFKNMPYFWLIAFAAFVGLADYNYRHTKNGYKHNLSVIIIANLVLSVILGFGLFGMGAAKAIDKGLLEKVPPYARVMHEQRIKAWEESDKLLAGEITKINEDIVVVDFQGQEWTIILPDNFDRILREGSTITAFGKKISDSEFKADRIGPWKGNLRQKDTLRKPSLRNMKENIKPPRIN